MIKYGLTQENQCLIQEKAKSKKDGVYMFRGVAYKVKNNQVTHYAHLGEIIQSCYGFNVQVGNYSYYSSDSSKAALREIRT